MTLPANIRVNVGAPFPSLVKSTGGIALQKANGIWTVSLGYSQLGVQVPLPVDMTTDYVAVYDSVVQSYYLAPLGSLGFGGVRTQRSITAGPVVISPTDQILHLNLTTPTTITLPPFATRDGVPMTFKDVGMQASTNPVTIAPAAGETIDGFSAALSLNISGQAIALTPANDGVNSGWWRE
jgi:hypothetical protein